MTPMKIRAMTTIVVSALALACVEKDYLGDDEVVFDVHETTVPCPDLVDWPEDQPVGVQAVQCSLDGSDRETMSCVVAVFVEDGHAADFAIEASGVGVLPWNELPWNAEAGDLENADLTGSGNTVCTTVTVNTATIRPWSNSTERYFDFVISDDTLGLYTLSRVTLQGE